MLGFIKNVQRFLYVVCSRDLPYRRAKSRDIADGRGGDSNLLSGYMETSSNHNRKTVNFVLENDDKEYSVKIVSPGIKRFIGPLTIVTTHSYHYYKIAITNHIINTTDWRSLPLLNWWIYHESPLCGLNTDCIENTPSDVLLEALFIV
jgi:hypothetical protein